MTRSGYTIIGAIIVFIAVAIAGVGVWVISGKMDTVGQSLELAVKIDSIVDQYYDGDARITAIPEHETYSVNVTASSRKPSDAMAVLGLLQKHLTPDELSRVDFNADMSSGAASRSTTGR